MVSCWPEEKLRPMQDDGLGVVKHTALDEVGNAKFFAVDVICHSFVEMF